MRRFRSTGLALVTAVVLHAPALAGGLGDAPQRGSRAGPHLGLLGLRFLLPFVHRGMAAVSRPGEWKTLGFEVDEGVNGLYLDVAGSVQFHVAEIVFLDGGLERVPLSDATRSDGLFALSCWDSERGILGVRLQARACSSDARLSLVLGKDPPPIP